MEIQEFGARLRELRKQTGLSQRELADKVGINFTYLSKIERGVMPPPSEKVILRLAEVLNADNDELMTLAGRIPPDIAQILKSKETLQLLRSGRIQEKGTSASKKEGISIMEQLANYKKPFRVAIAVVLVCAIAVLVWFASPVTETAIAVNNQGVMYTNEGEYNKAIVALTKAIELDPNLASAFSNRAWVYIELKQYEQAIADCTKAIEINPSLASAYSHRGWAYIELGQYEQAIADYIKAIELDPSLKKDNMISF